jgi:hypothetical protein
VFVGHYEARVTPIADTNWESDGAPVQGRQVVVDLAGGAQTFDLTKISAHLRPGQNRFTALREFDLRLQGRAGRPRDDRVELQADRQRPARRLPERQPQAAGARADPAHVGDTEDDGDPCRLRRRRQPVHRQESFQGEQDNDQTNATDCRTGSPPLPPRNLTVRAAELEVLSTRPEVIGAVAED